MVREKITARLGKKARFGRKIRGARLVREKITSRWVKKARFGRKIGGKILGSRENYGQMGEKSKFWP
ncbi:MAG: hypothetical protein SO023_05985 [Eubacterium sp.]|nr:hypothetical protein [Eubacterium sp.]